MRHLGKTAFELELLKRPHDNVLHVLPAPLHPPQQIQERVVAQLEVAADRDGFTHHHFSAHIRS